MEGGGEVGGYGGEGKDRGGGWWGVDCLGEGVVRRVGGRGQDCWGRGFGG